MGCLEIRLAIHTTEPLTGTATAGPGDPLHFEGWLELLRALATLTGTDGDPAEKPKSRQPRPTREPGEETSDERDDNDEADNGVP